MRKVILTEKQFKDYLKYLALNETNKIRPWTDADYTKANPYQIKDVDFGAIKQADDEYNKEHGLTGRNKVNTGKKKYSDMDPIPSNKVDALQADLTNKIQKRYMDATGRETPVIPSEELGTIGGNKLRELLEDNGLLLSIGGKSFAYGNTKLPEDTMIVNLTSAWNCPSIAAGECPFGKDCYARGTELYSKQTQERNLRMQNAYKYLTAKEILQLLEAYIESAPVRIKRIRISEDGDFPDQQTVDFCDKIAGHLKAKYGIITTAYTARNLDYSGVKNMLINGSNYLVKNCTRYFKAIPEKRWELVPDGLVLEPYDVDIPKQVLNTQNGTFKCHCDCRKCNFCYQTKEQNGEPADRAISVAEIFRK